MNWDLVFNVCALLMMFGIVANVLIEIGRGTKSPPEKRPGWAISGLIAVVVFACVLVGIVAFFLRP